MGGADAHDTDAAGRGYERRDVRVRTVLWIVAGFAAAGVLISVMTYGMTRWMARNQMQMYAPRSMLGSQEPPPPRLQVSPAEELGAMRARERQILESYGWVARERGIVRIPIERAMELTVQRAATQRAQGAAPEGWR